MKNLTKIAVLIGLSSTLALTGCGRKAAQTMTEPSIPVKVMTVSAGTVSESTTYAVTIEPINQASIAAKMGGRVESIPVQLGSYVNKGQALIRLDAEDATNAVRQAEAAVAQAQANLRSIKSGSRSQQIAMAKSQQNQAQVAYDIASKHHERMKGLYEQSLIAKTQYEQAYLQMEQARAGLESAKESLSLATEGATADQIAMAEAGLRQAEAGLATARTQLANTVITAPCSGYITMLNINPGEMASPGMPIVAVAELSEVYAVANVGQSVIALLQKDSMIPMEFEINGEILKLSGRVEQMAFASSAVTKTYPVKILISNRDQRLKGGMVGKAWFTLRTSPEGALVVPADTVLKEDGETFVYLAKDSQAIATQVSVGLSDGKLMEIKSGLKSGDSLIVSGQYRLKPSSKIEVK